MADHQRIWDKVRVRFDPLHYLALLERKAGALYFARPLENRELPERLAAMRRRLEADHDSEGTREYISLLRLLEKRSLRQVEHAVGRALVMDCARYELIAQHLYGEDQEVATFPLDGREHLKIVNVACTDPGDYLYFMSAEFAKTKPYFAINPERMCGLARVNEILAESFDPDKHKTSTTQLAGITETVRSMNRRTLSDKILSCGYASLGYREGYGLAVKAMFGDHAHCFNHEAETQTLTIDGGGEFFLLRTTDGQYPLQFLSIKRLVPIDTVILNSSEIAALKMLEVADLRGSQLSSIGGFEHVPATENADRWA